MALDPGEFLAQAELLAASGTEAGYRSAVSRAYYACHLLARDRLFGLDAAQWRARSRRPSHYAVINALRERVSTDDIARDLEDLKKIREVADYVRGDEHPELLAVFARYGVSGWENMANRALLRARDTFAALEESLPAS